MDKVIKELGHHTNGEILNQQCFELTVYNELPLTLFISLRPIELQWVDNDPDSELINCIDANTGELIAVKGMDVLVEEYDHKWLNSRYKW